MVRMFSFFIVLCSVLVGIVIYAPRYLVVSDKLSESQLVVLFLGSEFPERKQEASKLIKDGYAKHLAIPEIGMVYDFDLFQNQNKTIIIDIPPVRDRYNSHIYSVHYPNYFESTHVEIIEAKKIMDKTGFKTAIFVSSPYHMRRIRLIAKEVFGKGDYRIHLMPTRFRCRVNPLWFLSKQDMKFVASEYIKIIWFKIYKAIF